MSDYPALDKLNDLDGHCIETKRRMDVYLDGLQRKLAATEAVYANAVERDDPHAWMDATMILDLKNELCDYGRHFPVMITTGSAHFDPECRYWDNYQDHLVCSNCCKEL